MSVSIETSGEGAERKLQQLLGATKSSELYGSVGAGLKTLVDLGFKSGCDPWGQQWAPLKFRGLRRTDNGGKLSRTGREQAAANKAGRPGQPRRNSRKAARRYSRRGWPHGVPTE